MDDLTASLLPLHMEKKQNVKNEKFFKKFIYLIFWPHSIRDLSSLTMD